MAEAPAGHLGRLRALVEADLDEVAGLLGRLAALRARAGDAPADDERMAMGGYVHHAYTGMEAALERIVREIDGGAPAGARAHRDLIESARVTVPSVRPAIIGAATFAALDRLLRFRHAYRHGYAMRLEWSRLDPVVEEAGVALLALRADFDAFWRTSAA